MDLNKMKVTQYLLFILIFTTSCHTPATKTAPPSLEALDTIKAISHPDPHPEIDSAVVLKTHLRDTTYAAGSFILFLRPDDARYGDLEKEAEDEAGDGDADFGVGIRGTQDSLKKNDRYKDIKVVTSTNRYICISDCKDGPLIIDRDSVSYGFILSARGKPIAQTYNSVHSGDYVGEIEEYFFLH
jgi:hypothetical protein